MIIGRILLISSTITEKHKNSIKREREHRTVMTKYAGRFLISNFMEFELWS